jgi:hypothetical protein
MRSIRPLRAFAPSLHDAGRTCEVAAETWAELDDVLMSREGVSYRCAFRILWRTSRD